MFLSSIPFTFLPQYTLSVVFIFMKQFIAPMQCIFEAMGKGSLPYIELAIAPSFSLQKLIFISCIFVFVYFGWYVRGGDQ